MEKTYLVFDIETIDESSLESRGEELREDDEGSPAKFPPIHRHKIVAIGALWLSERYYFKKLGIFSEGKDERAIVEDFNGFMTQKRPILVSFNGRRFDVPVIFLRSIKYGLLMDWHLRTQDYTRRYPPTRHLDLCDILADYGASGFTSLDNMAHLLGLPGKAEMDGSMVQAEFFRGNLAKINGYCLADVVMTTCIFLRYSLAAGDLSPAEYAESLDSLVLGVREEKRMQGFISETDMDPMRLPPVV